MYLYLLFLADIYPTPEIDDSSVMVSFFKVTIQLITQDLNIKNKNFSLTQLLFHTQIDIIRFLWTLMK